MSTVKATDVGQGRRRKAILWLLALNLFVTCALLAFAVRYFIAAPSPKFSPARRIELIADSLSSDDASVLRTEFLKRSDAIDQARERFSRARDAVRAALLAEPYVPEATRDAMSEAETAHRRLEQLYQDVIASAASKITSQGRAKLAEMQSAVRRDGRSRFSRRFWWGSQWQASGRE